MSEKLQSGFSRSRPFGGLAILAGKSVISSFTVAGVDSADVWLLLYGKWN